MVTQNSVDFWYLKVMVSLNLRGKSPLANYFHQPKFKTKQMVTKPEAALTALSTSALSPSWTSVMISSVAGLMVANVLPDTEGWNSLLMKICNYITYMIVVVTIRFKVGK